MKIQIQYYNTFRRQIELLPRLTIIYSKTQNGFAIEWLWFGVYVNCT